MMETEEMMIGHHTVQGKTDSVIHMMDGVIEMKTSGTDRMDTKGTTKID